MVRARGDAAALSAELVLCATAGADLLTDDPSPRHAEGIDHECHNRSPEENSAICRGRELPRDKIESVLIHRLP